MPAGSSAAPRRAARFRPKNLRNADVQLWNLFVAAAKARGVPVGDLWNQVVREWLHAQHLLDRGRPGL